MQLSFLPNVPKGHKNTKQNLLLTTLDAQKAFDVVDHNSLLRRLYLDRVQGDDWLLLRDLYSDCSSSVKWAGLLSEAIIIRQGVRQGESSFNIAL